MMGTDGGIPELINFCLLSSQCGWRDVQVQKPSQVFQLQLESYARLQNELGDDGD